MNQKKKIDLVIPIFNEEEVLAVLFDRLGAVFSKNSTYDFSVYMVDDGSRDNSASLITKQQVADRRYHLVQLSRNFGHQQAISAGLEKCSGDAAIFLDADLQDPPELITEMLVAWENGNEVVRAERLSRSEKGLRRLGFQVFHRFFSNFSDHPIPANSGTFSLLDRAAYESLRSLPEKHRFFPGLCAWIGFRQDSIRYHREDRAAGEPKQSLRRLIRYALDALFSFSYVPLRMMIYAGVFISLLGFSVGFFFVLRRLLGVEVAFTGFTTIIVTILGLGGLQLICLGIIGEYLARIYDETKGRPFFIVRAEKENTSSNQAEITG